MYYVRFINDKIQTTTFEQLNQWCLSNNITLNLFLNNDEVFQIFKEQIGDTLLDFIYEILCFEKKQALQSARFVFTK